VGVNNTSTRSVAGVRVRVPAKVNLYLGVGERRNDGYHELVTVFQALDLCDEVFVSDAAGLQVRISGEGAGALPTGPENLAWRAAELLARRTQTAPHACIDVTKAIPVGGGMAGGSADAAATLVACAALWRTGSSRSSLVELAAEIGSDVAFCVLGGTALGTSRGEVLTPVLTSGEFHWVLAVADFSISTAAAYAELDRQRGGSDATVPVGPAVPDGMLDALRAGDASQLARTLGNDLEPVAVTLAPQLQRTLDTGRSLGALAGIVSGSGPTCAFLCADQASANALAMALPAEGVCRSARVATGPVAGARVVS
jgi:4-diphosphocytidyl-2-C-methyl-D-erythritol kinase